MRHILTQAFQVKYEGRPAMKRLLQDVKDNKIEMVLSWKLNRISRSMRDVFNIIHEFKEHDVGINRFLRILIHPMLLEKYSLQCLG